MNEIGLSKKVSKKDLFEELNKKRIKIIFDSVIWIKENEKWDPDRTYNVVFHDFAGKLSIPAKANPENFHLNVNMGLFDPNGLNEIVAKKDPQAPIAFNRFDKRMVFFHNAYSPNNSKFLLKPGREIAKFWTSAIFSDEKVLIIIFNLLIDNNDIDRKIKAILPAAAAKVPIVEIGDIKPLIKIINSSKENLKNNEDINTANQAIEIMKKIQVKDVDIFDSIFEKGGYRDQINQYKKLYQEIHDLVELK